MTTTILLIACIILAIIGIIILSAMVIHGQSNAVKAATQNADTINMRLIALTTEVMLNAPMVTQDQIDNYDETIKERDKQIVESILKTEKQEKFDPFAVKPEKIDDTEPEEDLNNASDATLDASSAFVNREGK